MARASAWRTCGQLHVIDERRRLELGDTTASDHCAGRRGRHFERVAWCACTANDKRLVALWAKMNGAVDCVYYVVVFTSAFEHVYGTGFLRYPPEAGRRCIEGGEYKQLADYSVSYQGNGCLGGQAVCDGLQRSPTSATNIV